MNETTLTAVGIAVAVVVTPLAVGTVTPFSAGPTMSVTQDGEPVVEIQRFSVESMTVRNVTATDVVVRELTVRQAGERENVTLENVSLQQFDVQRAELSDVRFADAVLRGEGLLSDFGVHYARDSNVTNESRQSLSVENRTFDAVVVERLVVGNATGLNVSAPAETAENVSVEPSEADLVVRNASVESVRSVRASAGNETSEP